MRSPARATPMGRATQPLVIRQFATRLMKFLASLNAHAGEEILFRNHPHHLIFRIHHGHPGHPPPPHGRSHLRHRRVGLDRHHVGGHDLGGGDGPAQALQGVGKRQAIDFFKVARGDIQVPGDGPHGLQDILLFDL